MWTGYAYYNGTELWNNQRTIDYLRGNPATMTPGIALPKTVVTPWAGCGTASRLFCDPPREADGWRYRTPALDDAPWYDPLVPESADFAGLFVTEVTGFDSTVSRAFEAGAVTGSSFGPLKLAGRSLTVTGWLRAGSCCAAEYGLRWLTEALVGGGCDDCALGEMTMLKCCPSETTPAAVDYVRYMEQVGLVDGPKVTDRMGTCCAQCGNTDLQVQFTIASQSPYIFGEIEWSLYADTFPTDETWAGFSEWCKCTQTSTPTTWTPSCGGTTVAVPAPYIVDNKCYGNPWCAKALTGDFSNLHQWNDVTGYVEVTTGSKVMKNLQIVAYQNIKGTACSTFYSSGDWVCATPCATLQVAELPSGARLTIDSRTRQITLRLAGGTYLPGLKYVSGGDSPFNWFDLGHCQSLCVIVTADCSVAADATVSVGHFPKYLASGG